MHRGRRYHRVWIDRWAALSCAGDSAATWRACDLGRCALRCDAEHGWLGLLGERPYDGELAELLARLCQAWTLPAGPPALSISASKGDITLLGRLLTGDLAAFLPWQAGSLGPRLAARLGLRHFVGGSPIAACSTGLYALLHAADCLEDGQADWGLAGAADASCHPLLMAAYRNMGVLCRHHPPSAFSGKGQGFAAAEGAAVLGLTTEPAGWRLVAGVRLGDARHETRCEDPAVLQACLSSLWELLPEPDLIVAHATGTAVGDRFEQAALAEGPWSRARVLCCKPQIGHCLGASGIVELAAALEAPVRRLWKLSLGFGGHVAAVACEREP
jgi:hypothetical protein